jgi:hypothetical protein
MQEYFNDNIYTTLSILCFGAVLSGIVAEIAYAIYEKFKK